MTKCQKPQTCGIFLKRGFFRGIKDYTCVKRAKTNKQIHKYNIWRSARKTQHVVYFWKDNCSKISQIIFSCAERTNTKIQINKYKNTQIQHMAKCQKDPTCGIFLKRGLSESSMYHLCIVSAPSEPSLLLSSLNTSLDLIYISRTRQQ